MTTIETTTTFGERARAARKTAELSTIEAAYRIRDLLPQSEWKSYQAIHRLEVGDTGEESASPAFVAALAKVYGVPLEELSLTAAASRQRLLRLFLDDTLGDGTAGRHGAGRDETGLTARGASKKRGSTTRRNRTGPGRDRTVGARPAHTSLQVA